MLVLFIVLMLAMLACALMAFRAKQLIVSALWLAGCSAILSILMYLLGAFVVAVIELSVGAGLVTVLFVFAISIAGDETVEVKSISPRPIALIVSLVAIVLLGFMTISSLVSCSFSLLQNEAWKAMNEPELHQKSGDVVNTRAIAVAVVMMAVYGFLRVTVNTS